MKGKIVIAPDWKDRALFAEKQLKQADSDIAKLQAQLELSNTCERTLAVSSKEWMDKYHYAEKQLEAVRPLVEWFDMIAKLKAAIGEDDILAPQDVGRAES